MNRLAPANDAPDRCVPVSQCGLRFESPHSECPGRRFEAHPRRGTTSPVLEFKVPEGFFEFKVPEGLHGVDRLPHNVNVRVAGVGSTLPAGSRARTRKVWLPEAGPTFLHFFFFLHFLAA